MSVDTTFVPARGLSSGHVITVYAWAHRRTYPGLPSPERRLIRVSPDTQVRADCYWQPDRAGSLTVVGLHGLEGSSESHYMRGLAHKGLRRGWNVVLLNHRNCGGTEHLTPGLYHSGLSADPLTAISDLVAREGLPRVSVVGYSLGGNLTVKLASELAGSPGLPIISAVAVCPTIDLTACADALERRQNLLYQWNFLSSLKARMRRKATLFPGQFDLRPLRHIHSLRKFDDTYTAPLNGFGTSERYYHLASAVRGISRITIPTMIIAAEDDPFVPATQFTSDPVRGNTHVRVNLQRHGGHCGFVAAATPVSDGYWAEESAIDFVAETTSRA